MPWQTPLWWHLRRGLPCVAAILLLTMLPACQVTDPTAASASPTAVSLALTTAVAVPTSAKLTGGTPTAAPQGSTSAGRVDRDITYCSASGVDLKMDVYYPKPTQGLAPAAMYVHGGAWMIGDKRSGAGSADVDELVARGYLVAAIDYRLAPRYKFPAQIEDCKCAVRHLRANAAKYGLDPERIGAWGGSAGGHLVALLGLTDPSVGFEGNGGFAGKSSAVRAVTDMFGPSDLPILFGSDNSGTAAAVFGAADSSSPLLTRASPVTYVSRDAPPFLIMHGDKDQLVPLSQSQELYNRLTQAGANATLVVVKNAGHGFAPTGGAISPSRGGITKTMADFFDRYLKAN